MRKNMSTPRGVFNATRYLAKKGKEVPDFLSRCLIFPFGMIEEDLTRYIIVDKLKKVTTRSFEYVSFGSS